MPNQRAKNKVYLGGFIDKTVLAQMVQLAKKDGMSANKFGFATQLITESLKRRLGRAFKPGKDAAAKKPVAKKAKKR